MIQVKDNPHLFRDSNSKGIVNTDYAALQEHRNKRKVTQDILNINNEINTIKEDIDEVKHLLRLLINK